MILHITQAEYLHDYQVKLGFNNGKEGIANLETSLNGLAFSPLRDKNIFAQLKLDPELETICWPNGVDLAPEYLYYQTFKDDPNQQKKILNWGY